MPRSFVSPKPALALSALVTLLASSARAEADDCPPGSIFRSQDGYSFCEPTVCQTDAQCNPNEVCRPVPLCMQVGTLGADAAALGDAGKRLVVTQRCAPDKTCPQTTVCSDLGRCVTKAAAEKMGILAATASAAPASSAGAAPEKKSCGCDAVGARSPAGAAVGVGLAALAVFAARRRRMDRR